MLATRSIHENHKIPKRSLIARNWWVIVFVGISCFIYSQSMQKKKAALFELESRFQALEQEKQLLVEQQEELMLQVQSQSDPAWIEMTLMKGLGLVPDGQRKVYFHQE
jgi:hypothetical protein